MRSMNEFTSIYRTENNLKANQITEVTVGLSLCFCYDSISDCSVFTETSDFLFYRPEIKSSNSSSFVSKSSPSSSYEKFLKNFSRKF